MTDTPRTPLLKRVAGLIDAARSAIWSDRAVFPIAALILVLKLLPSTDADPDLFARVATGRLVEINKAVPAIDPFAFTPKNPFWIDHEWLSGVVFWWIAVHWGDLGLFISKIIFILWSLIYVVRSVQLLTPRVSGALVWIALCFLHGSFAWASTVRCQIFTYLFIPILIYGLLLFREKREIRYLVLFPAITFIWCNLHGGFTLGLIIQASFLFFAIIFRESWKLPLGIFILSIAATVGNPYGFTAYWEYILDALSMKRSSISEWAPLWEDKTSFTVAVTLMLPILYGLWKRQHKIEWWGASLLFLSAYCAFCHTRLLAFMMVVWAIFGPYYFDRFSHLFVRKLGRLAVPADQCAVAASLAGAVLLGIQVLQFLAHSPKFSLNYDFYAVDALNWIRSTQPPGQRVLVDFNQGSIALWRLFPHSTISIDGRYEEVYPQSTYDLVARAFVFSRSEGKAALEQVAPTLILAAKSVPVPTMEQGLAPNWIKIYEDAKFVVFGAADSPSPLTTSKPPPMWQPLF